MKNRIIYTIGHSNHEPDAFADLLRHFGINCVVDVRSIPASGRFPQFNKAALSEFLKSKNIQYLLLAKNSAHVIPTLICLTKQVKLILKRCGRRRIFKKG